MTHEDQAAYHSAVDPWTRRAERERKVVSHVLYRNGHAAVTLSPRPKAQPQEGQLL